MPKRPDPKRPTVDDVDPEALAVNATDDQTRLHQDPEANEPVQSTGGDLMPVDDEGRPHPATRDTADDESSDQR